MGRNSWTDLDWTKPTDPIFTSIWREIQKVGDAWGKKEVKRREEVENRAQGQGTFLDNPL